MQNFSARTGISLAADSADGYQIPPGLPQSDFCLLMQNFGRCEMAANSSAPPTADEPQLRYDGAQIGHLIIPICDGRHLLGRLVSEPFAVARPDFATVYELARALPVHPDNLMRATQSVPVVSQTNIMEAANLVHTLVQHVVAQNYKHQDVQGSITITPLLQQERIRGTLGIYAAEASRDPESDLHLLSMLAAQAVNSLVMLERLVASEEQALTDSLTGLYNYRFFQESLQRELSRASRSKASLSLIVLDLDNFKAINDSYGHGVGDRVLRHLADLIQRHSRKANVVVRYGGDEFCIIVPEGDLDTARAVAERVLAEIRNSPYADEAHGVSPLALTVSAGVTSYRPEEANAFSFFKRADENLLTAKRTGKDLVVGE